MQCPRCQYENREGLKFCNQCGIPLSGQCAECGFTNESGSKFCGECGASLTAHGAIPNSAKSIQPETDSEKELHETSSSQIEPHTRDISVPDAERRQLTVMFCDLVDSTALSGQLDPEDLRDVIKAYQAACNKVIQHYDGYVAQLLGDGLLVYFGYPQAHEDDAQRAIHAGLGMLDAMGTLNQRLEHEQRVTLAIRVGIHTGLVVVGEMGGEGRQEQLALGETPNVAARIQGIAEPDTVVISTDTHRLIQGYFDCQELGEHELRGVSQPTAVYRVIQESGARNRLDVVSPRGLTPLIGREAESTLLFERWAQATDGNGQVVVLSGEAGIGKSRLVQVLKDQVAEESHTSLECRSSPYFTNSALYPIIDMLQQTLRWQQDDTPGQRLEKLEHELSQYQLPLEETVPLVAVLLSIPMPEDRYPSLNLSPQLQRQKTLEAIVTLVLELSERQPLLFVLEDLHWSDPTTLEFLELLIAQIPTASVYALLTCRPEYQPNWAHRSYLTEVTVNRLSYSHIERLAEQVADEKHLPEEVIRQLVDKTDGVPLYVEEMTKAVLESGVLKEVNGQYELMGTISDLSIPATLQDSLMSRLDRLMTAKVVAQLGAAIGRQFSYELLQAVSELDETMLQHELGRLVESELIYQRGLPPLATYTFKHALIQDTAYQSLLRSTRQGYHRRIAEVLVDGFRETMETQAELLAHHYTEAGMNEQAVIYWQQAGEKAVRRSAHVEAIEHLNQGLELLATLPHTSENLQRELDFQTTLGPALMATKGYGAPDVENAYTRARVLCEEIGDSPRLYRVLGGLGAFYLVKGQYHTARELAESCLTHAQQTQDPMLLQRAYAALGQSAFLTGAFGTARRCSEQGIAIRKSAENRVQRSRVGIDPEVSCRGFASATLWCLGYPEQALYMMQSCLTRAQELANPFSEALAQDTACILFQFRREWQSVYEHAETLRDLALAHGFAAYSGLASMKRGQVLVGRGYLDEGLASLKAGLTAFHATGAKMWDTLHQASLVQAYDRAGQFKIGLLALDDAFAGVNQHEERVCEAELYRIKGELLLSESPDNISEAESSFHQAISIAQNQSAKSWELRAATSLARLWQQQNKRQEAYDLLAPVYDWFTEGFDTADMIDAKALLDELEGSR